MSAMQIKNDFKSVSSIWHFVGLSILSGGFYPYYWVMRSLEVLNDKYSISEERTKTPFYLVWVGIVITFLLLPFFGQMLLNPIDSVSDTAAMLSTLSWLASIIFAFLVKGILEDVFAKNNINKELSTLWAIVFNYFYLYYVLSKLTSTDEQDNTSA